MIDVVDNKLNIDSNSGLDNDRINFLHAAFAYGLTLL